MRRLRLGFGAVGLWGFRASGFEALGSYGSVSLPIPVQQMPPDICATLQSVRNRAKASGSGLRSWSIGTKVRGFRLGELQHWLGIS